MTSPSPLPLDSGDTPREAADRLYDLCDELERRQTEARLFRYDFLMDIGAEELGRKIARARKLRRLTQRELAEKLSVHPSMVTRWEKGQIHPRDKTLDAIAEALEFSIEDLLNLKSPGGSVKTALHEDAEMQRCLELLDRMSEEDRKMVRHMIQALAFRHQVQSLGQSA